MCLGDQTNSVAPLPVREPAQPILEAGPDPMVPVPETEEVMVAQNQADIFYKNNRDEEESVTDSLPELHPLLGAMDWKRSVCPEKFSERLKRGTAKDLDDFESGVDVQGLAFL